MAALAFSIKKKPTKPALQAANPLFAAAASAEDDDAPRKPRDIVIPLTKNPWAGVKAEAPATTQPADDAASLDERAAAAIIAEGVVARPEAEDLVIKSEADATDGDMPILKAAMLPGLADIDDDGEKFRRDVALRADDIDCDSNAYRDVRIEEFGRGLLRGMGWGGFTEDDEKRFADPVARPRGLGLGAAPKPDEVYDKRGKLREGRSAVSKDAVKAAEKAKKWLGAAKAEKAEAAGPALAKDDVVLIERPRGDKTLDAALDGARARVRVAADPVRPNHARVELESTGEVLAVPHRALKRLDAAALAKKPFREYKKRRRRDEEKKEKKRRKDEPKKPATPWLRAGIRVRVGRDGDALFRKKGRVLDVLLGDGGARRATLALDDGRRVDEPGYKEKHLETALPGDGGSVLAVLGPRAGQRGTLLQRDKKKETATVRFDDDDEIETHSMDHVAEWCGE